MATKEKEQRELINDDLPSGKGKGGTVTQHGGISKNGNPNTTGYQRGCRCDECKAAMTAYSKLVRERKAAGEPAKPKAEKPKLTKEQEEAKRVERNAKAKARRDAKKAEAAAAADAA